MARFTPRRIALVALAVTAAGAAYFLFRPSAHSPKTAPQPPVALLMVDAKPQGLLPGGAVPTAAETETYRKTQAALVKSECVINAALRDPKVRELDVVREQSDPIAWLAEHVTVEYGDNSSVLRIGVTGVRPKDAAHLANAVAGAFLGQVVERDVAAQRHLLQQLEDTQSELTRALDARKKELAQVSATAGVPPNATDHRALLAALYQERAGLRVELAKARAEKDAGPRIQLLREEVAALDERIQSCEHADLDQARAKVGRLENTVTAVASEITRLQVDMKGPARVMMLAPATLPEATATAGLRR